MRSLNKPNKPVYFSMRYLTEQWDSVRFIGLFGLFLHCLFFQRYGHHQCPDTQEKEWQGDLFKRKQPTILVKC